MHRVVTKRFDHRGNWIVESGPWHLSRDDAENWASILRSMGYHARVESQFSAISSPDGDDDELRKALMNLA